MKVRKNLSIALGFLGLMGISAIAAHPAHASAYASKSTTLTLQESKSQEPNSYTTLVNGKVWQGEMTVDRQEDSQATLPAGASIRTYYGTFRDNPDRLAIDGKWKCTGTIQMSRSIGLGSLSDLGATLDVLWKVTGGNQCPSVGQTFYTVLAESLPRANVRATIPKTGVAGRSSQPMVN